MPDPRHRAAILDTGSGATGTDPRDRIESAIAELRGATRELIASRRPRTDGRALAPRGLVLITDDGGGIARAVAADLRALGHHVLRVRHGVGAPDVEGVNLTASASVAALIERARGRGAVAAIVHASPLRGKGGAGRAPSWDDPDDSRSLALLAQAAAEDLQASARRGGACLVVARPMTPEGGAKEDRLARWIEISSRSLTGVRVRGLNLDLSGEPEVQAAEVVRAVLGTSDSSPAGRTAFPARVETEAILLGAPDRAAWIHLAAALIDWLEEAEDVRLIDLAHTLHHRQPDYPFRVGLVASSGRELVSRLGYVISRLAVPSCRAIHELAGAYWIDREGPRAVPRRSLAWVHRLRHIRHVARTAEDRPLIAVDIVASWSGRDLLNHLAASRFARGERIGTDRLLFGRTARRLDLTGPPTNGSGSDEVTHSCGEADLSLLDSLEALDGLLAVRREILIGLLT